MLHPAGVAPYIVIDRSACGAHIRPSLLERRGQPPRLLDRHSFIRIAVGNPHRRCLDPPAPKRDQQPPVSAGDSRAGRTPGSRDDAAVQAPSPAAIESAIQVLDQQRQTLVVATGWQQSELHCQLECLE